MADYPGKFLREHFQRRIEIQKKKNGMTKNEASSNSPIKKTSSKKPPTSIELKKTILQFLEENNPHRLHQALRNARSNGVNTKNMVNRAGVPFISIATSHCDGKKSTIKLLISFGASIHAVDRYDGQTPLHIAASKRFTAVVEYLLSCGANANAKDARGRTPLMIAAFKKFDHLQWLLQDEGGADADMEDIKGSSTVAWSSHGVHPGTMADPFLDNDGIQEKKLGINRLKTRMHMRYIIPKVINKNRRAKRRR
jgi:ankyrin repeat protein